MACSLLNIRNIINILKEYVCRNLSDFYTEKSSFCDMGENEKTRIKKILFGAGFMHYIANVLMYWYSALYKFKNQFL